MKNAIVFGIGTRYRHFKKVIFDEYNVVAFADNDVGRQGTIFDGLTVYDPAALPLLDFDVILVTPEKRGAREISAQLEALGIAREKVVIYNKTVSPFLIDPYFFAKLNLERKKQLFKDNVELVYLELSSQCNRQCWMCSNTVVDRRSKNIKMDHELYVKILRELREIDYTGDLSFSVFNEPTLDPELDNNFRTAKQYLPNAYLHFNTNGDFIDKARLEELEKLGLNFLPISLYIESPGKPWSYEGALRAVEEKAESLGLTLRAKPEKSDTIAAAAAHYKSLPVVFRCANHRVVASDRAGSLPQDVPVFRTESASRLCSFSFTTFPVHHTGEVTACCNFRPDFKGHEPYVVGNAGEESIFEIFAGQRWNRFRKEHIYDVNNTVCATCGMVTDVWGDSNISNFTEIPFRDRPRFRK